MAKVKSSNKLFNFQISGIELIESHLTFQSLVDDKAKFKFDINMEHRLLPDQNLLLVVTAISVRLDGSTNILGSIRTNVAFLIDELKSFLTDDGFLLPEELVITINTEALSTTRGMMFSSFRGTFLHKAILPIIKPKSVQAVPEQKS